MHFVFFYQPFNYTNALVLHKLCYKCVQSFLFTIDTSLVVKRCVTQHVHPIVGNLKVTCIFNMDLWFQPPCITKMIHQAIKVLKLRLIIPLH